jgi:hypothetical protein
MPYNFTFIGGKDNIYTFETLQFITYRVKFKPTGYLFEEYIWSFYAYEMVIEIAENISKKVPILDQQIPATIAQIFTNFFQEKEKIAVYTCETADGKHLARVRKFNAWFKDFNPDFLLKVDRYIKDNIEEVIYFNSLILRQDNPFKTQILEAFEDLIGGFEEEK